MSEFLRFSGGEDALAGGAEVFAHGSVDGGRGDEVMEGDAGVGVVLHHAGESDVGSANAVEFVEIVVVEGARNFKGAVASEVEEDDAVAVVDDAGGFSIAHDDERRKILVADALLFFSESIDGVRGAGEGASLSEDVGFPAAFDDDPIGFVAIHRRHHTTAARGDAIVAIGFGIDSGEGIFEFVDVNEGGRRADVATVEKGVDAEGFDAVTVGAFDHGDEVIDVRVDVAVAEQSDEVERLFAFDDWLDEPFPSFAVEETAGMDGFFDESRALGKDSACAEGVVSDFAIAHIGIARHADVGTVRV